MSAEAVQLIRDGMALTEAGRFDDAVGRFDAAVAACEGSIIPADRLSVAEAIFQKAAALAKAGQNSRAGAAFRDLVERFGSLTDTALVQQVCRARINEGAVAGSAGQTDEALAAFDDAIRRSDVAAEPWSAEMTADALYNKATVLRQRSRHDQAIATFDELIARFADSGDQSLSRRACMAMYNKAVELQKARKMAPAAAAFAATVEQFRRPRDPVIRERVARSLLCLSSCHEALGDPSAARASLDEFLANFGAATEPAISQEVDKLLVRRLATMAASGPRLAVRGDAAHPAMASPFDDAVGQIYDYIIAQSENRDPLAAIGFFIAFANKYRPREHAPLVLDHLILSLQRHPELHLWMALSFYCKGATLLNSGDYDNVAITYLAEFASRYLLDADPQIRYFVALALANTALGLVALGRQAELNDVLPAFTIKFLAANDPRIQSVVRYLMSRGSGYLDFAAPVDHPDAMLLGELSRLDKQEMLEPELREITQRDRQFVMRMLDQATQAAHERHHKALAIVEAYRRAGEPFGLFLRSFAIEAQQTLVEDGYREATPLIALNIEEPRVEWRLKAGLRDRVPVIGVANPVDSIAPVGPHAQEDFPKLSLPHDYWRAALLELIDYAAFVVVHVTDGSDGVIYELNTLLAMGRGHLTVVIAAAPEALPVQLGSFANIVNPSVIAEDAWEALPALDNLLRRAMFARSLPPELRRHQSSVDERFAAAAPPA